MEIIVGTNSYFTLAECENIIANNFMSMDSKRIFWNTLSDNDKQVLIVYTHKKIDKDAMCYLGVKADKSQNLQFPRIIDDCLVECPYDIKVGTVLAMLDFATKAVSNEEKLKELGIESYSDGSGASIKFNSAGIGLKTVNGINKEHYIDYFKPYTILV